VFCPSIQCPAIEYSFLARGCLGELYRVLGLGEPFLGELKLVLELVEGFLEELKLVEIVEFFCLLVQQLCCREYAKSILPSSPYTPIDTSNSSTKTKNISSKKNKEHLLRWDGMDEKTFSRYCPIK
jgi:hypothetical protein